MANLKSKEELAELLRHTFLNSEELNKWLDFPHPSLGNKTPRSVIEEGGADAVYTLIDNARNGLPL